MHSPYSEKIGREYDFKVKYRFFSAEEGGRKHIPFQGYRSDFWYEHPEHKPNNIFMIWPEFEDEENKIILDNNEQVQSSGIARMWIIVPERIEYHKGKIFVGMTGYFMEGPIKVAECEVIELNF